MQLLGNLHVETRLNVMANFDTCRHDQSTGCLTAFATLDWLRVMFVGKAHGHGMYNVQSQWAAMQVLKATKQCDRNETGQTIAVITAAG